MMKYLLIAAGGAFGSVLRFAVQGWMHRLVGSGFPAGTLAVNVLGCFLVGLVAAAVLSGPVLIREEYRLGLMVGILGGFTTFSTFGLETFHLANATQYRLALANVLLSCLGGFAAVWAGFRLAQWWYGA